MPRSEYVYVVMHPGQIAPFATFTVKRECRLLFERMEREAPSILPKLKVFRMHDGQGGMIAEMTVDEILKSKS